MIFVIKEQKSLLLKSRDFSFVCSRGYGKREKGKKKQETGNGKRKTENGERKKGKEKRQTGNGKQKTGNREQRRKFFLFFLLFGIKKKERVFKQKRLYI